MVKELNYNQKYFRSLELMIEIEDTRIKALTPNDIRNLCTYVETPRIRKNIPQDFLDTLEECAISLFKELEETGYTHEADIATRAIYELLHIEYPKINRNFRECMRKRNKRICPSGRTKWEERKVTISRKKATVTRTSNVEMTKSKKEELAYNRINELFYGRKKIESDK